MRFSKQDKNRLVREEARRRALANMDDWYVSSRDITRSQAKSPPMSMLERPEFGNVSLLVKEGDSMAIADRGIVFSRRMKLEEGFCVVMDQFGGDFRCRAFEADGTELLIPVGHLRQDMWPEAPAMTEAFDIGTDTGSLAFLSSSDVKPSLIDQCILWPCQPGKYDFYYEELVVLGALKQARTRNIIVRCRQPRRAQRSVPRWSFGRWR